MENLKFDIASGAPSVDAVNQARRQALDAVDLSIMREAQFILGLRFAFVGGLAVMLVLWLAGYLPTPPVAALAGAVAFAIAFSVMGMNAVLFTFVFGLLVAFIGAPAIGGTFALGFAAAYVHRRLVGLPRRRAQAIIAGLNELDVGSRPNECSTFLEWSKSDATIGKYWEQLKRMGRKPVVLEFEAAKAWMVGCERDAVTDVDGTEHAKDREQIAAAA